MIKLCKVLFVIKYDLLNIQDATACSLEQEAKLSLG